MRWKLIAANLVTVLFLGIVAYFLVAGYYSDHFAARTEAELVRDRELFERSALLVSRGYIDRAVQRAGIAEVLDVYAQTDANTRRAKAAGETDAFAAALSRPENGGRQPEFVALTDVRGNVIARNLEPPVVKQRPLGQQFSSLSFALNGTAARDVWFHEGTMLDVSFAPVRKDGQVLGALVVGFDVSNSVAEENSRLLGTDVAYFIGGRVYSSSLRSSALQAQLGDTIFRGAAKELVAQALQVRRISQPFEVRLGTAEYQAFAGPLPGPITSRDSGYVVLANLTEAMAPVSGATRILWIMALAAVLAAIAGVGLGTYFQRPLEQIEESVLRVINGDVQHRIEIKSAEFGSLAYRINQLIGEMLGETEDDEETPGGAVGDLEEPKG